VPLVTEPDPTALAELERAIDALAGRRVAVLTGAGVSTDSGIPDYRGQGAPVRKPMSVEQFLAEESARRRYWVGSHLGWRRFAAAQPNEGHRALAQLEAAEITSGVITQNVDGLHVRAGSRRVVELHGTMRRVGCLQCGQVFDRRDLAVRVEAENPWLSETEELPLGPTVTWRAPRSRASASPNAVSAEECSSRTSSSSASSSPPSASVRPSSSCATPTHCSWRAPRSS